MAIESRGTLGLPDGREMAHSGGTHWLIQTPLLTLCPLAHHAAQRAFPRLRHCSAGEGRHPDVRAFTRHFPNAAMFLDLETCGFAGSPIFLVGLLHQTNRGITLSQLLARNYAEEKAILTTLWQWATDQRVLITFNGKSFDWPQVHDRSTMHRLGTYWTPRAVGPHDASWAESREQKKPRPVEECPNSAAATTSNWPVLGPNDARPELIHFDILHHARRRWKQALPNCRLQTLEWYVCGRRRTGDIPGRDIPQAYHDFVRTGDASKIRSILHHNALDLVTLLQLALRLIAR